MNHVLAGKPKPKVLSKAERQKAQMNDPDYEMNMANDKKKLQDNLNADE